jgi:PAS domain S-box-containing protein
MQRYKLLFEHAESAQALGTTEGRFFEVNDAMGRLFGYAPACIVGMAFTDLSHPDDVDNIHSTVADLLAGAPRVRYETRGIRCDGTVVWVEVFASVMQEYEGATPIIHATILDITERMRAARVMEARFELTAYAEDHDVHELLAHTLDVVTDLTGSLLGFYDFVEPDQQSVTLQVSSTRTSDEFRAMAGDGRRGPVASAGARREALRERRPVIHNDCGSLPGHHELPRGHVLLTRELVVPVARRGTLVALLGVGNKSSDYTAADVDLVTYLADVAWENAARRKGETELRLLHTAVEQSPASVVITDKDGAIEYVNAKFCQVSGYTAEEARGNNPRILKSGATSAATYAELWQTIGRGDVWRGQLCNRRKDGSLYWENASISGVRHDGGPPTHFIAVKEDVTAQRALEVQLLHAQKLEAVGQLASGIAHEINTPAQFASDSVHFLAEAFDDLISVVDAQECVIRLAPDDPARSEAEAALATVVERADLDYLRVHAPKAVAMSKEGLSRIGGIVRAMKDFSHPSQGDKRPADLNAALDSTLTIARHEYKYVAEVVRDFGELPPVPCLVGELNQVFLNLIVNAAHAIAEVVGDGGTAKGTIAVRTRADERGVTVEISDTGCGIAEANRLRVFDPFFTTKAVGRGTGQGLTIARSIVVNKHGGELTFESEEGKGSIFRVWLPLPAAAPHSLRGS